MLRTGLLNLQVATLQVAASAAGMKTETRRVRQLDDSKVLNWFLLNPFPPEHRTCTRRWPLTTSPARGLRCITRPTTAWTTTRRWCDFFCIDDSLSSFSRLFPQVRAGVTLALGCLAAAQAAKEHSEL